MWINHEREKRGKQGQTGVGEIKCGREWDKESKRARVQGIYEWDTRDDGKIPDKYDELPLIWISIRYIYSEFSRNIPARFWFVLNSILVYKIYCILWSYS